MSSIDALLSKVIVQLTRPTPNGIEVRFVTKHHDVSQGSVFDIHLKRYVDIDTDTYYVSLPLLPLECSPGAILNNHDTNFVSVYQTSILDFCKNRRSTEITHSTLHKLQSIFRSKQMYGQEESTDNEQIVLLGSSELDAQLYIDQNQLLLQIVNLKDSFDLIGYDFQKIKDHYIKGDLVDAVKMEWEAFLDKVRTYKLYELADSYRKAKIAVADNNVKLRALNLQTEAAVSRLCKMQFQVDLFDDLDDIMTYWPFEGFVKTTGELVLSQDKIKTKAFHILKTHYQVAPLTGKLLSEKSVFVSVRDARRSEITQKISHITRDINKEIETADESEKQSLQGILDLFSENTETAMVGLSQCTTLFDVLKFWPEFLAPAPDYVLQQA